MGKPEMKRKATTDISPTLKKKKLHFPKGAKATEASEKLTLNKKKVHFTKGDSESKDGASGNKPLKKKKVHFGQGDGNTKHGKSENRPISMKKKVQFGKSGSNTKDMNRKFAEKAHFLSKKGNFMSKKYTNKAPFKKDKAFKNDKTSANFTGNQIGKESEKPKWSEMKKEKKELRLVRRKAKSTASIFELSHKAKLLAAQIQRKVIQQSFRLNACKELHMLLKGQYKSVALTHDLSRVIQVLLKYSEEDIKNEITEELMDIMVQMVQSKYAQHAVKRILKYGTDFIRHQVIKKFQGSIVSLSAHTISAPIIDYAYSEFATQKEKNHMHQEFYGELFKNTKDDNIKCLKDSYKDSPEMKAAIVSSCKANIQRVLDKNLHDSELLHSVLYDYIQECNAVDRAEMITTLSPLIVPLSNSLPGVNTACLCIWQGTNKDKKTILKVVKEHVVPLSTHKTGYRLILAIFDSVDDTVLVKKALISTVVKNIKDIAKDHWGKMTLHWLVKPSDTAAFHPSFIRFLKDGAKLGTSKKDADLRIAELREAVHPALKNEIQSDPRFWLNDPTIALLTVTVLSIGSTKEIVDAIASVICDPNWYLTKDSKKLAVEDAGMHMCLKKMVANDQGPLVKAICEHMTEQTLQVWLPTNRGCFLVLKLIEKGLDKVVTDKIVFKLNSHVAVLEKQLTQGGKLLLKYVEKKIH